MRHRRSSNRRPQGHAALLGLLCIGAVLALLVAGSQGALAQRSASAQDKAREARAQYARGNYQRAADLYREAWSAGRDVEHLFQLGMSYAKMSDWDRALNTFTRILKLDPRRLTAFHFQNATRMVEEIRKTTSEVTFRAIVGRARMILNDREPVWLPLPRPMRLSHGEHTLLAAREGHRTRRMVFRIPPDAGSVEVRITLRPLVIRRAQVETSAPAEDPREVVLGEKAPDEPHGTDPVRPKEASSTVEQPPSDAHLPVKEPPPPEEDPDHPTEQPPQDAPLDPGAPREPTTGSPPPVERKYPERVEAPRDLSRPPATRTYEPTPSALAPTPRERSTGMLAVGIVGTLAFVSMEAMAWGVWARYNDKTHLKGPMYLYYTGHVLAAVGAATAIAGYVLYARSGRQPAPERSAGNSTRWFPVLSLGPKAGLAGVAGEF